MILDDLKSFLQTKGIAENILLNFDSSENENIVLLRVFDGIQNSLGKNSQIEITSKNTDITEAQNLIYEICNILCPVDQFQKQMLVNSQPMHIKALKGPFYDKKEENGRYCFIFNVNVDY